MMHEAHVGTTRAVTWRLDHLVQMHARVWKLFLYEFIFVNLLLVFDLPTTINTPINAHACFNV